MKCWITDKPLKVASLRNRERHVNQFTTVVVTNPAPEKDVQKFTVRLVFGNENEIEDGPAAVDGGRFVECEPS